MWHATQAEAFLVNHLRFGGLYGDSLWNIVTSSNSDASFIETHLRFGQEAKRYFLNKSSGYFEAYQIVRPFLQTSTLNLFDK